MHLLSGQYVLSSLLAWSKSTRKNLQDCTIGIVGVGHVGKIVARYGKLLGMQVLLNDPPGRKPKAKPILFLSKKFVGKPTSSHFTLL